MSVGAFDLSQLPAGWQPIPERLQSSLDNSDQSTEQTVRLMCKHIAEAVQHPRVRAIAARTSGSWGRGPRESRICWDVFWFCKHHVRFMIDEHAVLGLYGETDQVDFLITPPVLLSMHRPAGDCDDFTMLSCALLECNGVPWEIVTVATERADPRRWSHVYCRAVLPDGRRLALDPTNGVYPGWEVPEYDVHRKQYWNMQGQPVDGPASIKEPMRMHGYVGACGLGCAQRRGMGDQLGSGEVSIEGSALPTDLVGTPSTIDTTQLGPVRVYQFAGRIRCGYFRELESVVLPAWLDRYAPGLDGAASVRFFLAAFGRGHFSQWCGDGPVDFGFSRGHQPHFYPVDRRARAGRAHDRGEEIMREVVELVVFVVCALGVILYSLPPEIGGPPL